MIHSDTRTPARDLETLFHLGNLGNLDDGQLLERFRTDKDARGSEAARLLVERYGAIIMGICRGVLGDADRAEDAFQATFLVLFRRAGSIRNRQSIGPWLHGVALRVARKARARAARRSIMERPLEGLRPVPAARDCDPADWQQVEIVHDEIARLPGKLRDPLILCCLEGRNYNQAARLLGTSEPTLRGRLHRARRRLEERLKARGIALEVFLPAGQPTSRLVAPVALTLAEGTENLVTKSIAVGGLVIGAGRPAVQFLAQGALSGMIWNSAKTAVIPALLTASLLGVAVMAQQDRNPGPGQGGVLSQPPSSTGPADKAAITPKEDQEQAQTRPGDAARLEEKLQLPLQSRRRPSPQDLERKTARIRELLATNPDLNLPDKVTLEQLLKTVKMTTTSQEFPGIPIYVNPLGLQEADHTLSSLVSVRRKESLAVLLKAALLELRLGYDVTDGFLVIDSRQSLMESRLERVEGKLDRLMKELGKQTP